MNVVVDIVSPGQIAPLTCCMQGDSRRKVLPTSRIQSDQLATDLDENDPPPSAAVLLQSRT